ncbi:hypothetical protein A2U01_0084636, partial [Trifolium medium]|nr:hypothetical protein [Trifolium medium]
GLNRLNRQAWARGA